MRVTGLDVTEIDLGHHELVRRDRIVPASRLVLSRDGHEAVTVMNPDGIRNERLARHLSQQFTPVKRLGRHHNLLSLPPLSSLSPRSSLLCLPPPASFTSLVLS